MNDVLIRDHPFIAVGVFLFYVVLLKLPEWMTKIMSLGMDTVVKEYTKFSNDEMETSDTAAFQISIGSFIGAWIVMIIIFVVVRWIPSMFFKGEFGSIFISSIQESKYFRNIIVWGLRYIFIFSYIPAISKFWKKYTTVCNEMLESYTAPDTLVITIPNNTEIAVSKIKLFRTIHAGAYIFMNTSIYLYLISFIT